MSLLNKHETLQDKETIIAVSVASLSCLLSIFGSSLIIGTYACYPQIRKPARGLLFWLSITDLGTAISYSMTFIQCGGTCNCKEYWQEVYTLAGIFFPVASFLWTDCIGLYIYAATYQKTWIAPRERLFTFFHIICWGLPSATILSIGILKALKLEYPIKLGGSATGGWCWIQQWQYDLLGGKVIEIFSYVFLMVVYVLTWKELKRINHVQCGYKVGITSSNHKHSPTPKTYINPTPSSSHTHTAHTPIIKKSRNNILALPTVSGHSMLKDSRAEDMRKQLQHKAEAVNRLLFIPVVFFALRIWGTTHMFVTVDHANNNGKGDILDILGKILAFAQAACDPLQGFCNGILFVVFVSEVRQHLFNTLSTYIGYKWLNCCGLICCCHYCCSCICRGCNECFECCLMQNKPQYQYNNLDNMRNNNFNNYGNQQFIEQNGTTSLHTDYYAAKYQFLPQTAIDNDDNNGNNNNHKIKGINNMIKTNHPTIASPSISRD